MSVLSPYELDSIAAAYPHLSLEPLSTQQEQVLLARVRGLNVGAAAAAAGMSKKKAQEFLDTEKARVILDFVIKECRAVVTVDRDLLSTMLFEAHDVAATSGEKISAIRELGNLHDLYPSKNKAAVEVNINGNIHNQKQLERLSDEDLLRIAGNVIELNPERLQGTPEKAPLVMDAEETIEEAEYTEVIDGDS